MSQGLREKWTFCKEAGHLSGTYDMAMEMIDRACSDKLYEHICSEHCKTKGQFKYRIYCHA